MSLLKVAENQANKALNIKGKLFQHYKGGVYRVLFSNLGFRSNHFGSRLFMALHSDDCREISVDIHPELGEPFLHDVEGRITTSPAIEHVAYISLTYGSIWVRPRDEFFGLVHEDIVRFMPIESVPKARIFDPEEFWKGRDPMEVLKLRRASPCVLGPWRRKASSAEEVDAWVRTEDDGCVIRAHVFRQNEAYLAHVKPGGYHEWSTREAAMEACDHLLRTGRWVLT